MGYKKVGKNMSFAASGSESLPLGETWLSPAHWSITAVSR